MNNCIILGVVDRNLVRHCGHFLARSPTSLQRLSHTHILSPRSHMHGRRSLLFLLQKSVLNFAHRLHYLLVEGHLLFELTF